MRGALRAVVGLVAALKLLVWWLEPRMAFFPYRGIQETPAAAHLEFSDLEIPTSDGETLHAWWLEAPEPRAQIIYWHGNGGNLSLWMPIITDLRQRGLSVLAVDYRGYGRSTGKPSESGLYRDADAATAYFMRHLRKEGTVTVYWGRSLGCAVASYAATQAPADGLILESPFPDVKSLFVGNPIMRLLSVFSSYKFPTSRHLARYSGPLLVVHGDADSIVPFRAGQNVFEHASSPHKTLTVLPGADHNDVHPSHPAYWPAADRFIASVTTKH